MEAVLLVGGQATRLRPLTDSIPKALVPIANVPHIERMIEHLEANGVRHIVLASGYLHDVLERALKRRYREVRIDFAVEHKPLDTAGAVRNAWPYLFEENFFVLNGDILTTIPLGQLMEAHTHNQACVTLALVPVDDPSRYGVVVTDVDGRVQYFVEKPAAHEAPTNLVNAGVYVFNRKVLQYIPPEGAYSIERQLYPDLIQRGLPVYARVFQDCYWIDVGKPDSYMKCNFDVLGLRQFRIDARELKPGVWIADGASIASSALLEPPVLIGPGCVVAEGAQVGPHAIVGKNCRIGARAKLAQGVLLDDCVVGENAKVEGCVLGTGCVVQPNCTAAGQTLYGCGEVIGTTGDEHLCMQGLAT